MNESDQNFDQSLASMRDAIPRIWWSLYQGCLAAGFDQRQSFGLVQTYILGQNPYGIQPPTDSGPKPDSE